MTIYVPAQIPLLTQIIFFQQPCFALLALKPGTGSKRQRNDCFHILKEIPFDLVNLAPPNEGIV